MTYKNSDTIAPPNLPPVQAFYFPKADLADLPERVTIKMPDQLEDFLFAAMCLSSFRGWVMALDRKNHYTICCKPEWIPLLIPFMEGSMMPPGMPRELMDSRTPVHYIEKIDDESRAADLMIDFDREIAYELSRFNKRHAVESYGIMIGSQPAGFVPCYGRKLVPESPVILYLPRHASDYRSDVEWPFVKDLIHRLHSSSLDFVTLAPDIPIESAYNYISRAVICIGVAGGLTSLAASLGQPLLELYPENLYHENWAAKWGDQGQPSSSFYRVIRENPENIPPDFVLNCLVKMVQAIVRRSPWLSKLSAGSTTTERLTSPAQHVER